MAEIDASIPLSANPSLGLDATKMLSLADMAMRMRANQQAMQNQNALKTIFANPQSYDPKTNQMTPQAMRGVMAVDPQTGMQLQQDQIAAQVKAMQLKSYETEAGTNRFNFLTGAAGAAYDAYESAIKAGRPKQDAISAAAAARNEIVRANGGVITPEEVEMLTSSPFEPEKALAFASANKEWSTRRHQERTDAEHMRHDEAMEGHAVRMEEIAGRRADNADPDNAKWQVLTDPEHKDEAGNVVPARQYRYNPQTAESTTLDGKPYSPTGAAKINAGGQPRSGSAIAVRKYLEEHPDATSADVQNFLAKGSALSSAARSWATGKEGNTVRSLDVAVSHIDVLNDLVGALDNGDVKLINAAKNRFESEFGGTAPGNFDAAKGVVGDEIVKAVLGSGAGSDRDRRELQENFNNAKSPDQLRGVIKVAERLMGGQLSGLRQQYKRTTGNDDFDDAFLSARTKSVLGPLSSEGGSGSGDYSHLWK